MRDAGSPIRHDFSHGAGAYAASRPTYPAPLFAFLASQCPRRDLAWDCGTGNGQAALGLAEQFAAVLATDPSQAQLDQARAHPRVTYRRAGEGDAGLPAASADLVAAAQAFHWFDAPTFFGEARRVLRPGGVVAIWCYGLCTIGPEVDPLLRHFHDDVVGGDWPPGRALVNTMYRDVAFPFDEVPAPPVAIELALDLPALGAYLGTWSAVQRHRARTGHDPLPDLLARLGPAWGDPAQGRAVTWPLGLRVGRWTG